MKVGVRAVERGRVEDYGRVFYGRKSTAKFLRPIVHSRGVIHVGQPAINFR